MHAHVRTRSSTVFSRIRLILLVTALMENGGLWWNLAEFGQASEFICRVFHRDVLAVTRPVLLHNLIGLIFSGVGYRDLGIYFGNKLGP